MPRITEDGLASAKHSFEEGDVATAVGQLRMWAEIQPRRSEGWVLLGQVLAGLDDRDGAIEAFERSLGLVPVSVPARQQLAGLYLQAGRVDEARVQATIARDNGAQLPPALLRLVAAPGTETQ